MVLTVYMWRPHLASIFHPGILGIPPLKQWKEQSIQFGLELDHTNCIVGHMASNKLTLSVKIGLNNPITRFLIPENFFIPLVSYVISFNLN